MNKKMMCFLICICFLIPLQINCNSISVNNDDSNCYGFIVTYQTEGNYSNIDRINCKIRHLINDLLREKILIYWTTEEINIDIKKINSSYQTHNKLFVPGSFIVPFTGNSTTDKEIIAIIYDYNQSSEIEIYDEIKIPIYIISEQVNTHAFLLNDVYVSQYYSGSTSGGFIFLELLSECGFLNFEIIKGKDINSILKWEDFNVLFIPGGLHDHVYLTIHKILEEIFYKPGIGVRDFINNGGGYIGVCGGQLRASAGYIQGLKLQLYQKRQVYNPELKTFGCYSLADFLTRMPPKLSKDVEIKIVDNLSPISYGLNYIFWNSWFGGHRIEIKGKNLNVVSNYINTGTEIDGYPDCVTTTFGDGKVVTFSTHPEIAAMGYFSNYESKPNDGKILISNSLFYTTAEDKIDFETLHFRNLTYLEDIWEATADLTSEIKQIEGIFNSIREKINETYDYIDYLKDKISQIINLIDDITDKFQITNSTRAYKYYLGKDFVKDVETYYLRIYKDFYERAITVFDKIESIYYLLKNDPEFIDKLDSLTMDLSEKINETNEILSIGEDMLYLYKENLIRYQKKSIRSGFTEFTLKNSGNNFYTHIFSGFSPVIKTYTNSLKLLRQIWYEYETSIII